MGNNAILQLDEPTLRDRYSLLCQVCDATSRGDNSQLEVQLQHLEQLIEHELPALARRGSPDHVADLLHALRLEMVRFREFCAYPELHSKVVVGLGGSFSAGKSSLINALIGDRKCLVTEVDPTTSLPTYLVQGQVEEITIHAINHFNRRIALTHAQFRTLTHEEKALYGSQVSALLKSVVVVHPALPWANLTLLDTPGYSKADEVSSERTDANVARTQLNSAQFIVWLVPAEKGIIPEEDIVFLASLARTIPKLVVLSRSDKHPPQEIENIVELVRDTLAKRGIAVLDVIPFSNRPCVTYNAEPLLSYFAEWDKASSELGFTQQFKRQFMAYQEFIDEARQEAQLRLSKFNRILTLSDDSEVLGDIDSLQYKSKVELVQLEQLADLLDDLQLRFFNQLKQIGDSVGIPLPEPDILSLLALEPTKITQRLQNLANEWGLYATACDYKLWELLNQDLPLTGFDMKVLGHRREVAQQNEEICSHYAVLLLMVLLDQGSISELQQQMLDYWLPALGLAGRQAALCIEAGQIAQDQLSDAIKQLKQDKDGRLVSSLLLDSILFTRLGKPLAEKNIRMLGMLAGCFEIDEQKAGRIVCLAILALGLPTDQLKDLQCNINLSLYQTKLGVGFEMGDGVAQDYQQAVAWYRKAAELGYAAAQYKLGRLYLLGRGVMKNRQQAIDCFRNAAELGDASSQYILGMHYSIGCGVEWDKEQAEAWYRKAAEQGHAAAQCSLGVMYDSGQKQRERERGEITSLCQLTVGGRDDQQAVAWYRKAAELGYAAAQCNLGVMYTKGRGVAQDYQQAIDWYRKAAEQGYLEADCELAAMYIFGNGVDRDIEKGLDMLREAAEKGYVQAYFALEVFYCIYGDKEQRNCWLLKAAELGNAEAHYRLGLYSLGDGDYYGWIDWEGPERVGQDYQLAVTWFRKAAELGHAGAQVKISRMYETGKGVVQDYLQAYVWCSVAASTWKGFVCNCNIAHDQDRLAAQLTSAQLKEAQALVSSYLEIYSAKR